MHADIFKEMLISRELVDVLYKVGIIDGPEYAAIVSILIRRIDRAMKDRDHGMPGNANMPE